MCANSYNYLDWLIVIHQIEMLLWHPVYLNLSVLPYILFLLHSVFDILIKLVLLCAYHDVAVFDIILLLSCAYHDAAV